MIEVVESTENTKTTFIYIVPNVGKNYFRQLDVAGNVDRLNVAKLFGVSPTESDFVVYRERPVYSFENNSPAKEYFVFKGLCSDGTWLEVTTRAELEAYLQETTNAKPYVFGV